MYHKSSSTIYTILKQNDKILAVDPSKNRPPIIDNVEKLLLIWINEKQMQGNTIICEKARQLYADLFKNMQRMSTDEDMPFRSAKAGLRNSRREWGSTVLSVTACLPARMSWPPSEYVPMFKSLINLGA